MGLTRKIMSVSTMGAVDFRSDKERIARKTAKGARAAKKGNKLIAQQNELLAQQNQLHAQQIAAQQHTPAAPAPAAPVPPPPTVPAGWYPDPNGATIQRYWDGTTWTDHTAPIPQ